jgi:acetolactate synthase-1/2/3 large subunit
MPTDHPNGAGSRARTAARLLVECLRAEGVDTIFGVPGEETMDILDALAEEPAIRYLSTRHEQGAAFAADVYGRLTGRPGVALATLGPGATNLLTGVADAHLDRSPLVAITGQAASARLHKEAHQVIDVVRMFEPVTKWNARVERPETLPEMVRKAFRLAALEKPGPTHLEISEDVASAVVEVGSRPLPPTRVFDPEASDEAVERAARLLRASSRPLLLVGAGVLRRGAAAAVRELSSSLHVPVATTFMAKGAVDDRDHLSLMAVGLQARDHVMTGFDRADLIVTIGYDLVEYAPSAWNAGGRKPIVHIDSAPAETDADYQPAAELVGDIAANVRRLTAAVLPAGVGGRDAAARHASRDILVHSDLRTALLAELAAGAVDDAFPMKPQRVIAELRAALAPTDVVITDVGAHKLWMARLFPAYEPNTLVVSNGLAAMGIAVPGALAAGLVAPDRRVVAVCGDGGFLMNVQELETMVRADIRATILVWRDGAYGLIDWKQRNEFGRTFGVDFGNPDMLALATAFGIRGFRPGTAAELGRDLRAALDHPGVSLVDVAVDGGENLRLSERLGALASGSGSGDRAEVGA